MTPMLTWQEVDDRWPTASVVFEHQCPWLARAGCFLMQDDGFCSAVPWYATGKLFAVPMSLTDMFDGAAWCDARVGVWVQTSACFSGSKRAFPRRRNISKTPHVPVEVEPHELAELRITNAHVWADRLGAPFESLERHPTIAKLSAVELEIRHSAMRMLRLDDAIARRNVLVDEISAWRGATTDWRHYP